MFTLTYYHLLVKILHSKILSLVGALLVMLPFFYAATSLIILEANKWEMMEQLEKQSLQTVTLTAADKYYWEEEGREININGEMFDVESYTVQGDKLMVTGLFDKQEDALNDTVSDFFTRQSRNKGAQPGIQQLVSQLFIEDSFNISTLTHPGIPEINTNLYTGWSVLPVDTDISTPPPRSC
jgi:hypothetical protein